MKGTIVKCLAEMTTEKFGEDIWETILSKAGLPKKARILATGNIGDDKVIKIIEVMCQELDMTPLQVADAFGEYWSTIYAPKLYQPFYDMAPSARDFLLNLNAVHVQMTSTILGANPPNFEYEWKTEKTLVMIYKSNRGMIDFVVGLAKGVGVYYKEQIKVVKAGDNRVEVTFP